MITAFSLCFFFPSIILSCLFFCVSPSPHDDITTSTTYMCTYILLLLLLSTWLLRVPCPSHSSFVFTSTPEDVPKMDILSWVLASCALDSVVRAWACRSVDDARTHMYEEKNDDEKRNKDTHNDVDTFVIASTVYAKRRNTWEHANAGTKSRRPNQKQT